MDKKKKIILITIIAIILVTIIGVAIWCFTKANAKGRIQGENTVLKLDKLYQTLQEKGSYSFTTTLNNENKMYYAKNDGKAYTDTLYKGNESKFIIRDGNSYLLMEGSKAYYTYANNETNLNKVEEQFLELVNQEYEVGEEKIDDNTYTYEEFKDLTSFTMQDTTEIKENEQVKTRFYFKGDKLVYIKTIIGNKQELLKVDISYNVDSKLFEIPSDYKAR